MDMSCSACGMQTDFNASKCEQCNSKISEENCYNSVIEEWEDGFRFIEEAEIKGEVYELASSEDDVCSEASFYYHQVTQYIKEEPEIQIEPDVTVVQQDDEPLKKCVKSSQHQLTPSFRRKSLHEKHKSVKHRTTAPSLRRSRRLFRAESNIIVYKCEICNKITKDFEEHKKHKQSHENQPIDIIPRGLINCNQCDNTFRNNFDLKNHQKLHDGKKVSQCDICNVVLSNETVLRKHKARVHNFLTETKSKAEKYLCSFCGEKFPLQILMTNHKRTHTEDIRLLNESTETHQVDGRLNYICKICGKNSSNKSRHTDHLRVHTKEKPFKCDLCDSTFTARSSLRQHMRLHSDERPFKCHICDATYRHKKSLRNHLRHHTGSKPYKCQYCDKSFALKFIKVDHERQVHTGETLYQCNVCQEWFTTSAFLNAHKRNKHKIDTNSKRRVEILVKKINISENDSES